MKGIIKIVLIYSLCFCYFSINATDTLSCKAEYENIIKNKELDSLDKKLDAWQVYENSCLKVSDYYLNVARIMEMYNRYNEALNFLVEIDNTKIHDVDIIYRIGEYQLYLSKYNDVKNTANFLIRNYSSYFGGFSLLGEFYYIQSNIQLSHEKFLLSLEKNMGVNVKNYLYLTSTYYEIEDYENSCMCFEKAASLDPLLTVFSKGHLSDAVKSFIHIGNLTAAKSIIDNQLKFDKDVEEYKGFQEALKMYEDAVKNN